MTVSIDGKSWESLLESNQRVFTGENLRGTISYLLDAKVPGGGWGHYPSAVDDVYHSSLVIQALNKSGDPALTGIIAGASTYLRNEYGQSNKNIDLVGLCELINVAKAEARPQDNQYIEGLLDRIRQEQNFSVSKNKDFSMKTLCLLLSAVGDLIDNPLADDVRRWTETLLSLQKRDGSFTAHEGGQNSLVLTSFAVRAFEKIKAGNLTTAHAKAISYLKNRVAELGWKRLGSLDGIFTHSLVLRVLANSTEPNYEIVQEGSQNLLNLVNGDGSWGNREGEIGNIENTALALLALIAAGENRFVPSRLAKAAVTDVKSQFAALHTRYTALFADFERRVRDDCGGVVKERNDLLTTNEELKSAIAFKDRDLLQIGTERDNLQLRIDVLEREMQLLRLRKLDTRRKSANESLTFERDSTPSSERWIRKILPHISSALAVSGIFISFSILISRAFAGNPSIDFVAGLAIAIGLLAFSFVIYRWWERRSDSVTVDMLSERLGLEEVRGSTTVAALRHAYLELAEPLSPSLREELAYRLGTQVMDMPIDLGSRYADELMFRLDVPTGVRQELSSWIKLALRLSPKDRRLLFDWVQRMSIR